MIFTNHRHGWLSLENTANRGGRLGCYTNFQKYQKKIKEVCLENNLAFHLDGAHLFNALQLAKKKHQNNMVLC